MAFNIDSLPAKRIPVTNKVYLDYQRTDLYEADGSREYPFKNLSDAYDLSTSLVVNTDSVHIVLLSGNTISTPDSLLIDIGHIFITGENSSGTHTPIVLYATIEITAPVGSISQNHFGISNIEIIAVTPVIFSGTNSQSLFMKDVWITATGSGHGISMTNTGVGSKVHIDNSKFSHNGSGHYHCIHVAAGTANLDTIETSGANVGVIGVDGGTCNLANSDLQGGGSYIIDVYTGGVLTVSNTKISPTAANSVGIKLVSAGAIAIVGNVLFTVPASATTGRAISGITGTVLYYTNLSFLPGSNNKISSAITSTVISTTPSFVA
jgi:hypothetical protein